MKILAKTDHGYLVEANFTELCNVAGKPYDDAGTLGSVSTDRYYRHREFPIGTQFEVSPVYKHIENLRAKASEAQKSSRIIRALCDAIDNEVPGTVKMLIEDKA
jgi:hypothetical protein